MLQKRIGLTPKNNSNVQKFKEQSVENGTWSNEGVSSRSCETLSHFSSKVACCSCKKLFFSTLFLPVLLVAGCQLKKRNGCLVEIRWQHKEHWKNTSQRKSFQRWSDSGSKSSSWASGWILAPASYCRLPPAAGPPAKAQPHPQPPHSKTLSCNTSGASPSWNMKRNRREKQMPHMTQAAESQREN